MVVFSTMIAVGGIEFAHTHFELGNCEEQHYVSQQNIEKKVSLGGAAIIPLPRESFNLPGDSVEGLVVVVVVVARRIREFAEVCGCRLASCGIQGFCPVP